MSRPTPPKVQRHLAAIFAADVAGYSRLMEQDEIGTLQSLTTHREIMDRLIDEHGGRIANTAGDSVLAEFPSVVNAVQAAVEVQEALKTANEALPEDRQVRFRIGVHVGDVLVKGGDLLGDGVNIAARLQALAAPGGTCISGAAYEYVRKAYRCPTPTSACIKSRTSRTPFARIPSKNVQAQHHHPLSPKHRRFPRNHRLPSCPSRT